MSGLLGPLMDGLLQDFRLAARQLWKSRLVSAVAVASLALGVGANTAIFSLVNSLLLRPLPVRDPGRLAILVEPARLGATDFRGIPMPVRYPVWDQLQRHTDLFDGMVAWSAATFDFGSGADTQTIDGLWVSGGFFDVLGVRAIAGRTFATPADGAAGRDAPEAVISYGFWRRRFGGSADAIGRTVRLDAMAFTVIGVTPPDFFGPEVGRQFDVIVPIAMEPRAYGSDLSPLLRLMIRLKPGQTVEAASAALRVLQGSIRDATMPEGYPAQFRAEYLRDPLTVAPVSAASTNVRRRYSRPLLTIMAVVGLVLLIACGNVANLLLARATAKRHELSVRRALGASRWRLVRQLLVESVLLMAVAAVSGLLLGSFAGDALVRRLSTDANPVFLDLSMNGRVIAFTGSVSMATVLLFGVLPAFGASAIAPSDALNARGATASHASRAGVANTLVIAQIALSLVLVVTSGLLVRTFSTLSRRELGFDPGRVLVVRMNSRHAAIAAEQRTALYERVRGAVAGVPGVSAAGAAAQTPIVAGPMFGQPIKEVSGGTPLPSRGTVCSLNLVSTGWFTALGTPLVAGRDVSEHDTSGTTPVAIVNQEFAREFLNGTNPIGHTITLFMPGPPPPPVEIVGVVRDAVYGSLRYPIEPTIYLPFTQLGGPVLPFIATMNLAVRSAADAPATLARSVAAAVSTVNPNLALTFHPLADELDASLTQERVVAVLSGCFGAIALLLAALGLYGITSYAVARRRTEIGIRMALGATRAGIAADVLGRASLYVAAGLVLGIVASLWTSRYIDSLLYGLKPRDPATLASAVAVLALVALVAAWLPAHRAAHVDPAIALRDE